MQLILALLFVLFGIQALGVESKPYSIFAVKQTGYSKPLSRAHLSCRSVFSVYPNNYFEFVSRHSASDHITVQDGAYRPQYNSTGAKLRVSRFFSVKLPAYQGYWMWEPGVFRGQPGVLGQKMVEANDHFFNRWKNDFGYDPVKVDELNRIANQTNPLRKTHIGYRMDDVPWAEVTLFDASKTLRIFTSEGRLEKVKDPGANLSEIEIRFPELRLPERQQQKQGGEAPFFVMSKLTSLPEIHRSVGAIYHTVAQHLLLRLNPDLVQADYKIANIRELQQRKKVPQVIEAMGVSVMNGGTLDQVPAIESPLRVSIKPEDLSKAFYQAQEVKIYGVATLSMAKRHGEFGWQVNEALSRQLDDPSMVVIEYPVSDFIARFLNMEKFKDNLPEVAEKGKQSEEYNRVLKEENQRLQLLLEKVRRLKRVRRSL